MFKSVLYIIGGKSNRVGEIWAAHPDAIAGSYQEVIAEKTKSIIRIKEAVAGIQTLHDQKLLKLKDLIKEQENDKEVQEAIVAELQDMTAALQGEGLSREQIESDSKYIDLMNHYSDISDTIEQRQERIDENDALIASGEQEIKDYISEIKSLNRDMDNLKREAEQAKADIVLAKEEQALNDLKSGLATGDKTTEELSQLRSRVQKIKSGAKISKEIAGTNTNNERRRLLEKHRQSRKSRDLSAQLFQASQSESASSEKVAEQESSKLPE
jgi:chromosome segregation ATPase